MTRLSLIIIVLLFACGQNKKITEGDLYFNCFRFGSFYEQPDSILNKFKIYADTVNRKTISAIEKKVLTMYETLKNENLLYSPFVELRLDNDSVVKLYLNQSDYDKIKINKRQELQDNNKKIRIKVEEKNLGNGMLRCEKLISIDKIDGHTFQVQKKFKIDDYH